MSRENRPWRFLSTALAVLVTSACGSGRPEGWQEESHGKKAPARYDQIFAEDVQRLDIQLSAEDWQAMQANLEEILGPRGDRGPIGPPQGGGGGGVVINAPPEALEACKDKQEGEACSFTIHDKTMSGACMAPPEAPLACLPPMDGPPPEGGQGGGPGGEHTPDYFPCTVSYDGRVWRHVGIRFKGNSTLGASWSSGTSKMPLRLDFDELEDRYPEIEDQRFWGFKQLSLSNGAMDESLLHEKVMGDLFRERGLPAAATAFYRVYLDVGEGPVYAGLYTLTEVPNEPMLERNFGNSSGNLYKPEGQGADWVRFASEGFEKKTNEDAADWSDVEAAIAALHADRADAARWRAELEARFDVDGFLHVLALNTAVLNWDIYGAIAHNYFLYGDPGAGGRLVWIPWDHNEAFLGDRGMQQDVLYPRATAERWPLLRYLLDDPVYRAAYLAHIRSVVDELFANGALEQRLRTEHARIAPYVVGPEGEQPGYTMLSSPERFSSALEETVQLINRRTTEVRTQVDAQQP
jgi:hypothetical protein